MFFTTDCADETDLLLWRQPSRLHSLNLRWLLVTRHLSLFWNV